MRNWTKALIATGFLTSLNMMAIAQDNVTVKLGADGSSNSLFQVTDNQSNLILKVDTSDNTTIKGLTTIDNLSFANGNGAVFGNLVLQDNVTIRSISTSK